MPLQPIRLKFRSYSGKDPKKKQQFQDDVHTIRKLEEFFNKKREEAGGQPQMLTYYEIAEQAHIMESTVKRLMDYHQGPSGGFTF